MKPDPNCRNSDLESRGATARFLWVPYSKFFSAAQTVIYSMLEGNGVLLPDFTFQINIKYLLVIRDC